VIEKMPVIFAIIGNWKRLPLRDDRDLGGSAGSEIIVPSAVTVVLPRNPNRTPFLKQELPLEDVDDGVSSGPLHPFTF